MDIQQTLRTKCHFTKWFFPGWFRGRNGSAEIGGSHSSERAHLEVDI